MITRGELERVFPNSAMKQRCVRGASHVASGISQPFPHLQNISASHAGYGARASIRRKGAARCAARVFQRAE